FFGDETQKELDFWNTKVRLTARGSKEWLEVQGKIYDASQDQAREGSEAHLATLNEQISADKDNWAKEQKDLQDKLAFVRAHYAEQSAQVQAVEKEIE